MPRSPRSKESDSRMFLGNPEDKELAQARRILSLPPLQFDNSLNATLNSWPFYGGEGEENPPNDPPADPPNDPPADPTDPPEVDDEPKLSNKEIDDLLAQVKSQGKQVAALTKANKEFETKETKASRAQLGKEEALTKDLEDAQNIIRSMDKALREQAIINAIQGNGKHQFHSIKHVMREIDPEMLDFNVDLEKGSASVTGIDAELKRIAKECSWLVKKDESDGTPPPEQRPQQRISGVPPLGGLASNDQKQTQRQALMAKFPVIAHGTR